MIRAIFPALLAILLAPGLVSSARAAEVEFGAARATTLLEAHPTNNLGAEVHFAAGTIQNGICSIGTNYGPYCRAHALVKFDIAGNIPAGSKIRSVQLIVWVIVQPPADEGVPSDWFDLHRMKVPWTKGAGIAPGSGVNPGNQSIGRGALPGESCWDYRNFPTNLWGVPGGAAGIDYQSAASESIFIESSDVGVTACRPCSASPPRNTNLLAADVQLWLDQPGQNFGWLMKGQNETHAWTMKRFMVPESNIDDYPRLVVNYTPPILITNLQTNGPNVRFEFLADGGQSYQAQYRDSLTAGQWLPLTNIPAPPDVTNIVVMDATNAPSSRRFYRVIAP